MESDAELGAALVAAGVAGAVAMVGDSKGTLYARSFGKRRLEGAAVQVDDLFQIASMTKAIVSVAALQLVERGQMALDAPIDALLPELADPQVIDGFDEDGNVLLRPAKRAITLRHLLTHTSGFGYEFMSADMVRARGPAGSPAPGTKAALISPLLFDPGDKWEYGISTDWAGLAVEAASGMRLDAYLSEHVTGPLGMVDTQFNPTAAQRDRAAALYVRTPDGLAPMPVEFGGGPDVEVLSGGGGLYSTAPDYMRFLRMLLNGGALDGQRILSADTVAALADNHVGDLRAGRMESVVPALAGEFDMFPHMDTKWSLGFLINPETGPHGRSAGSLCWAGIANCYYWLDPEADVAGVLLTQLLPFGDPGVLDALGALERMAYRGE
ncbi:MAG: serine hydrolase domain-containing protein [Chakrabartia godavariana]